MKATKKSIDRQPTKEHEVWLFVDRFGKPNRRTWAIQYLKAGKVVYLTATRVISFAGFDTDQRQGPRQPKAWIVLTEVYVRWEGSIAIIHRRGDCGRR